MLKVMNQQGGEQSWKRHPDLGLHAASIEWIDDTHIRVTYDWSDDDQYLRSSGMSLRPGARPFQEIRCPAR